MYALSPARVNNQADKAQAIRRHIALEWKTWFFYRKLGADAGRANVALHGFAQYALLLFRP